MRSGGYYLSSGLDLIFADETLLHTRGAEGTGSDVSAGPEQCVSLHVGAHHALLQRLDVAVQRRAAGAHLPTGPFREKQQRVCVRAERTAKERLAENKGGSHDVNREDNMLPFTRHGRFLW